MSDQSPALKRYNTRLRTLLAIYVVALLAVVWTFKHLPPQGALRYGLAIAPAVPLVGMIWAMGRYIAEETDEFKRLVTIQSLLWATGLTLSFATIWGFVEDFTGYGRMPLWWMFLIFLFLMGLARPFVSRRYR